MSFQLPWGVIPEKFRSVDVLAIKNPGETPGDYVLKSLFQELTLTAKSKIDAVLAHSGEDAPIERTLQHGVDSQFDQLLNSFATVAQHCLEPLIQVLFSWRQRTCDIEPDADSVKAFLAECVPRQGQQRDAVTTLKERRALAVDFIFCRTLIEVLQQRADKLSESVAKDIEILAIQHFKSADFMYTTQTARNKSTVIDLYAEVIGAMSQTRFDSIRRRFLTEIHQSLPPQTLVNLVSGMKFIKLKMFPMPSLEESCKFMQECTDYFVQLKKCPEIKRAFAELFVELLIPVASVVKSEVNVPSFKTFVEMLYKSAMEMAKKTKYQQVAFPLVSALLCISQKKFFLDNWSSFLQMCLSNLKHKDIAMQRLALEAVYRMLWVYAVRLKGGGEGTKDSQARLKSIIEALLPRGSRAILPRDTPLDVFVNMVHFIAKSKIDLAMQEIIFDLVSAKAPPKTITAPERMIIGFRAFQAIVDDLQRNDGDPPFPIITEATPSGISMVVRAKPVTDSLDDITAQNLGLMTYHPKLMASLGHTLRALDGQVGRSLVMTNAAYAKKPFAEIATGERRLLLDLFKACLAMMPRLTPTGMTLSELVELLARMTIHLDGELRSAAYSALKGFLRTDPLLREEVIRGFVSFVQREIPDTCPLILEGALRMLIQLLAQWKTTLTPEAETGTGAGTNPTHHTDKRQSSATLDNAQGSPPKTNKDGPQAPTFEATAETLRRTEGLALLMLCSCRPVTRKLAIYILKEVRAVATAIVDPTGALASPSPAPPPRDPDVFEGFGAYRSRLASHSEKDLLSLESAPDGPLGVRVVDIIDRCGPDLIKRTLPPVPIARRRSSSLLREFSEVTLFSLADKGPGAEDDPWPACLGGLLKLMLPRCLEALGYAWSEAVQRLMLIHPILVENVGTTDSILQSSQAAPREGFSGTIARHLLRDGSNRIKKNISDEDISLWHNYLVFACCTAEDNEKPASSGAASGGSGGSTPAGGTDTSKKAMRSARELFRFVLPLIRSEAYYVRDAVVGALGYTNAKVYMTLVDEMQTYLAEARRPEDSIKKRRKRDILRLAISRVLELATDCFGVTSVAGDRRIVKFVVEYIEETKAFLCTEGHRDNPEYDDMRASFCAFVDSMCESIPRQDLRDAIFTREGRLSLFAVLSEWCEPAFPEMAGTAHSIFSGGSGMSSSGSTPFVFVPHASTTTPGEGIGSFVASNNRLLRQRIPSSGVTGPPSSEKSLSPLVTRALRGMASLCRGVLFDARAAQSDSYLFGWLDCILSARDESIRPIGQLMCELLLQNNRDISAVLEIVVERCYAGTPSIAGGYFSALAAALEDDTLPCPVVMVLNLVLYKTADHDQRIREKATRTLQRLGARFFSDKDTGEFSRHITVTTCLPTTYQQCQVELSTHLARQHPELTQDMFSEMTMRFDSASMGGQRSLLQYMIPWLANFDLEPVASLPIAFQILNNLFYITMRHGDDHVTEIEDIWGRFSPNPQNLHLTIRYLLQTRRNPEFLPHAKRIIVYLARTNPLQTINELVDELHSSGRDGDDKTFARGVEGVKGYVAPVERILPWTERMKPFARGDIALMLLVELVSDRNTEELAEHIPLLLHRAFLGLDHGFHLVHEHCKMLLVNIVHTLAPDTEATNEVIAAVRSREDKRMWHYEDITPKTPQIRSAVAVAALVGLVSVALENRKDIVDGWGKVAHSWAVTCSSRHYATRSFQVLRGLRPVVTERTMAAIMARLADCAADAAEEVQGYGMEILLTIEAMIEQVGASGELHLYPQAFWCVVASLESDYEHEFAMGVRMLLRIVGLMDVDNPSIRERLQEVLSKVEWERADPPFPGVQSLVLKGLTSPSTFAPTVEMIAKITPWSNNQIFDVSQEAGSLFNLVGLLPRLILGYEDNDQWAIAVSACLATALNLPKSINVSKMLTLYEKRAYTKGSDAWIEELCKYICEAFFPKYEPQLFTLLVEMLEIGPEHYQQPVLKILHGLIRNSNLQTSSLRGCSGPVMASIARMLKSPLWEESLKVLDAAMFISRVGASSPALQTAARGGITRKDSISLQFLTTNPWRQPQLCQATVRNRLTMLVRTFSPRGAPGDAPILERPSVPVVFRAEEESSSAMDEMFSNNGDGDAGERTQTEDVVHAVLGGGGPDMDLLESGQFFNDFDFLTEALEQVEKEEAAERLRTRSESTLTDDSSNDVSSLANDASSPAPPTSSADGEQPKLRSQRASAELSEESMLSKSLPQAGLHTAMRQAREQVAAENAAAAVALPARSVEYEDIPTRRKQVTPPPLPPKHSAIGAASLTIDRRGSLPATPTNEPLAASALASASVSGPSLEVARTLRNQRAISAPLHPTVALRASTSSLHSMGANSPSVLSEEGDELPPPPGDMQRASPSSLSSSTSSIAAGTPGGAQQCGVVSGRTPSPQPPSPSPEDIALSGSGHVRRLSQQMFQQVQHPRPPLPSTPVAHVTPMSQSTSPSSESPSDRVPRLRVTRSPSDAEVHYISAAAAAAAVAASTGASTPGSTPGAPAGKLPNGQRPPVAPKRPRGLSEPPPKMLPSAGHVAGTAGGDRPPSSPLPMPRMGLPMHLPHPSPSIADDLRSGPTVPDAVLTQSVAAAARAWADHVSRSMGDLNCECASRTFTEFVRLYSKIIEGHRAIVAGVIRVAADAVPDIIARVRSQVDAVLAIEIPFAYANAAAFKQTRLTDAHNSLLIEIGEHVELYVAKRAAAAHSLVDAQAGSMQQAVADGTLYFLLRDTIELHAELVAILGSFGNLVDAMSGAKKSTPTEVTDISAQLTAARELLRRAPPLGIPESIDFASFDAASELSRHDASQTIVASLRSPIACGQAPALLNAFRGVFASNPDAFFAGIDGNFEYIALLGVMANECAHDVRGAVLATVVREPRVSETCRLLGDDVIQLLAAVQADRRIRRTSVA